MQGSATQAEPVVRGKGPVPSMWLVSAVISCLLATLAASQYCNTGHDPAAHWVSARGRLSMGENQADRSLKRQLLAIIAHTVFKYCRERGEISYTQSARTEEGILYIKGNPNMLKVALYINLKLVRARFWNFLLSSGLGKLPGREKVQ